MAGKGDSEWESGIGVGRQQVLRGKISGKKRGIVNYKLCVSSLHGNDIPSVVETKEGFPPHSCHKKGSLGNFEA